MTETIARGSVLSKYVKLSPQYNFANPNPAAYYYNLISQGTTSLEIDGTISGKNNYGRSLYAPTRQAASNNVYHIIIGSLGGSLAGGAQFINNYTSIKNFGQIGGSVFIDPNSAKNSEETSTYGSVINSGVIGGAVNVAKAAHVFINNYGTIGSNVVVSNDSNVTVSNSGTIRGGVSGDSVGALITNNYGFLVNNYLHRTYHNPAVIGLNVSLGGQTATFHNAGGLVNTGVTLTGALESLTNSNFGTILGGVTLSGSSSFIRNNANTTISGGVTLSAADAVFNSGTIIGGATLAGSSAFLGNYGAIVDRGIDGVTIGGSGSQFVWTGLLDTGVTLTGSNLTLSLGQTGSQYSHNGNFIDVGTASATTLQLFGAASGAAQGKLSNFGFHTGTFAGVTVLAGASWVDDFANGFFGSLASSKAFDVFGTLTVASPVTVGVNLYSGATLVNSSTISGFYGVSIYAGTGPFSLTNTATGLIRGTYATGNGLRTFGTLPGTIVNAGTITGAANNVGAGVTLTNSGTIGGGLYLGGTTAAPDHLVLAGNQVLNGTVSGTDWSLELAAGTGTGTLSGLGKTVNGFTSVVVDSGATWTLTNDAVSKYVPFTVDGALVNAGTLGVPVALYGSVTNLAGAAIGGGILGLVGGNSVSNAGLITGGYNGINLKSSGTVTNLAGGTITDQNGVLMAGAGMLANSGIISGTFLGASLGAGGSITNAAGGAIQGALAVGFYGDGTVVNAGRLQGSLSTAGGQGALQFGTGADTLVVDPGAQFIGLVRGGGSHSTLELASAGGTGTIAGLGAEYSGFGPVTVDAGANWVVQGSNTLGNSVLLDSGALTVQGTLSGSVTLESGGSLTNAGSGQISGGVYGLYAGASVVNNGSIGMTPFGVDLANGGSVSNAGTIKASDTAVRLEGMGTVGNNGNLYGSTTGVRLDAGGSLVNAASGTIGGGTGTGVVVGSSAATLANAGTIDGSGTAVQFGNVGADRLIITPGAVFKGAVQGGGANSTLELASAAAAGTLKGLGALYTGFSQVNVDSGASWTLSGANTVASGVSVGVAGTLAEQGTLTVAGSVAGAVTLVGTGSGLTNAATGTLGQVVATGSNAVISNAGIIASVALAQRGLLTNLAGATVKGAGVTLTGSATVANSGSLSGTAIGVDLLAGGQVTNASGATIYGGQTGVYLSGSVAGTIVDAGSIAASGSGVAVQFGSGTDRLIVDAGATFKGAVQGGGANSTLELASTSAAGTLTGLGASFSNFGTVKVDAGALWTLAGSGTLGSASTLTNAGQLTLKNATLAAAGVVNNGTIAVASGLLTAASLTGTGGTTLSSGSTLAVSGSVASGETVTFAGTGATLGLGTAGAAPGSVAGFAAGDTVDLSAVAFDGTTTLGFNAATGALTVAHGTASTTLALAGDFTAEAFRLAADGSGGSDVTVTAVAISAALVSDTGASSTDHVTSNPALTGTAGAGATVTIKNGSTTLGTATASATGIWSFTPVLADGSYTLTASETNAAGTTTSASVAFTLDATKPVVTAQLASDTGSSATDGFTSNDALTGTGETSEVVTISNGATTLGTATVGSGGAWSFTPFLADGTYTLTASQTDLAGNTGSAAVTFTLDTKAPVVTAALASDTGASSSDHVTSNDALTGTGEAGGVVTISNGATTLGTATVGSGGAWSYTPSLADGTYTLTASQTDLAGNTGNTTLGFTLDTKAPVVTLGLVNDTGTSATDHVTFLEALSGTGEAGGVVTLAVVDGTLGTATVGSGGGWSFTPNLRDGTYTITASQTDLAGNVGQASLGVTIDTTAPTVTSDTASPATGDFTVGKVITFTLATSEAVTVTGTPTLTLNDGGTASYVAASSTSTSLVFSTTVAAGQNATTLQVTGLALPGGANITDTAGNALTVAAQAFSGLQVDTTAPTVTSDTASPATGDYTVGKTITFTLATGEAVTVAGTPTLMLNDGGTASYVAASSTSTSLVFSTTVAAGQNAATLGVAGLALPTGASIVDGAGNALTVPAKTFGGLQVDTTAPVVTAVLVSYNTMAAGTLVTNSPALSGTADPNATVTIANGAVTLGTTTASAAGVWTFTPTGLAAGPVTLTATDTDGAGNVGSASVSFQIAPDAGVSRTVVGTSTAGFTTSDTTTSFTASSSIGNASGPGVSVPGAGSTVSIAGSVSSTNSAGVSFTAGGTLTNSGSIAGGNGVAAQFGSTGNDKVVYDPGATFSGSVIANASGANTLELASGSGNTTIAGFTSQFQNFQTITVDSGASWTLTGTDTFAHGTVFTVFGTLTLTGATVNNGTFATDPSSITYNGPVTGTGTIDISAGSTVTFNSSVSSGQSIDFEANTGTLGLGAPSSFAATVFGTQAGDLIDFTTIASSGVTGATLASGNVLDLLGASGTLAQVQLDPGQSFAGHYFHVASDGANGTDVSESTVPCFCPGTLIRTPEGDRPVEQLVEGDLVTTLSGEARAVRWIGRRSYAGRFLRRSPALLPIRIAAGALADGLPARDLFISANHALYLEGALIPVGELVNGTSIHPVTRADRVDYLHLELDRHDVILAEGAPAESFLDDESRNLFQNAHEYWSTHPDAGVQAPALWCAPRLSRGRILQAVRDRLASRGLASDAA